jgi:hypothetical protein
MFQSFVVNLRSRESSVLDPEDYEEPILVETGEEHADIDAEYLYCSGLLTRETRRKVDQMHKMLQVLP